ncbi:MAG: hypothetical protein KDC80_04070 [Saprospiraceae bacterium]|nr:hypothetical protein [Saprospiraceae bacterium]
MRTALLVCDHVPDNLKEKHGDYPTMYGNLFPDLDLEPHYVCDDHFPALKDFDLFIITGSRFSVYDTESWILQLMELIRGIDQAGKKCIGICFGHQIIAEALGGKVSKASTGYLIGVHTFKIDREITWTKEQRTEFNVLMLCQDQVVRLPAAGIILASNALCPVGMYHVKDQFFAIQGHPEFSKSFDKDVFLSRKEKMGEEKIARALASFDREPDKRWLSDIMMRFVTWQW